jgi:hypothetical protein
MGLLPVVQQADDFGLRHHAGHRVAQRVLVGADRPRGRVIRPTVEFASIDAVASKQDLQPADAIIPGREC